MQQHFFHRILQPWDIFSLSQTIILTTFGLLIQVLRLD